MISKKNYWHLFPTDRNSVSYYPDKEYKFLLKLQQYDSKGLKVPSLPPWAMCVLISWTNYNNWLKVDLKTPACTCPFLTCSIFASRLSLHAFLPAWRLCLSPYVLVSDGEGLAERLGRVQPNGRVLLSSHRRLSRYWSRAHVQSAGDGRQQSVIAGVWTNACRGRRVRGQRSGLEHGACSGSWWRLTLQSFGQVHSTQEFLCDVRRPQTFQPPLPEQLRTDTQQTELSVNSGLQELCSFTPTFHPYCFLICSLPELESAVLRCCECQPNTSCCRFTVQAFQRQWLEGFYCEAATGRAALFTKVTNQIYCTTLL